MTEEPFETTEDARRDRREHGGASSIRPDDDDLARRTEQERVEAGIDDYDPDDVPPATDDPVPTDVTESEEFQEAQAELRREEAEGEAYPLTERHPFPPSHYDRS
ncbi:hypothetical protein AB0E63_31900 [Kribbella sp. NPDC026596]|uniref:hypothetical protein n=1 Tax=Kribbella sp. NPDC026596 TaxID=3155122 RepID=UPI0033E035A2